MSRRKEKYGGFLLTEIIVAIALLGLIISALAVSLRGFGRFNRYQLVTQQCIAAAQAQLDSMTATGKPIPGEDSERLWPDLTVTVEESPGADQWRGLTLAEATAAGKAYSKEVRISLRRYIAPQTAPTQLRRVETAAGKD
ncbi:MAG: type II secretion system protein [Sedimentisphaerales bacterium]|nr:type II secretion system protein [Sedimentisphaerales bacterium]